MAELVSALREVACVTSWWMLRGRGSMLSNACMPTGGELRADDAATMTLEAAIERLERLDLKEGALSEDRDR